jgi:hypothetical protein
MSDRKYLEDQARAARELAEAAQLPNVRLRHLNAAVVWTQLADRAARLEQMQASPDQLHW